MTSAGTLPVPQKRPFLRALAGIAVLAAVIVVLYSSAIEPFRVVVHEVLIQNEGLARVLGRRTVVLVTDLHVAALGGREQRVLTALSDLDPDILLIGGDQVAWNNPYGPAFEFLSRLRARTGIWGVLGEADHRNSRSSCLFCHESGSGARTRVHRVRFLRNSKELVQLPEGSFWIVGLDRAAAGEQDPTLLSGVRSWPHIVLSHDPLSFRQVDQEQDLFMASGDTHGGQVPLPGAVWRMLGYEKTAIYPRGLFTKGRSILYVSSGIGLSHLPFRLCRPPEIVVLRFVMPEQGRV